MPVRCAYCQAVADLLCEHSQNEVNHGELHCMVNLATTWYIEESQAYT